MKMTPEAIAEIKALEDRRGRLTPEQVVEAARDENSALHDCFEWDDSTAAEKYRIEQARDLLKRVKIEIEYHETTIKVVGYVRDPEAEPGDQGYRATMRVTKRGAADMMRSELAAIVADMDRAVKLASARAADLPEGFAGMIAGLSDRVELLAEML